MTPTEMQLLVTFRRPHVHLEEICEHYLGLSEAVAKQRAGLNALPFPTFRAGGSRKAPILVRISDLAAAIDTAADSAEREWERAQVVAAETNKDY